MPGRVLRATILGGLAALVLATHIFVDIDRVRLKALAAPAEPAAGVVRVRVTAADFPDAIRLRAPFALIARIDNHAGNAPFSVAVDGARVCERSVASGDARRIDCAVTGAYNPAADHAVTIQGPSGAWTLAYLELATHHGNTTGRHHLVVLPRSSTHYRRPSIGWVIAAWLLIVAARLLLPVPERMPRWVRVLVLGRRRDHRHRIRAVPRIAVDLGLSHRALGRHVRLVDGSAVRAQALGRRPRARAG